jgi:hypothetical protein
MNRMARLAVLGVVWAAGCASPRAVERPDPAADLERGLVALERGDYEVARTVLRSVAMHHGLLPVGQRAHLALVALEIDPRNEERSLRATADLAAHYLGLPEAAAWTQPLAEAFYLLALELGAAEEAAAEQEDVDPEEAVPPAREEVEDAEPEDRPLPELPRPTVPARLGELAAERDELQRQLTELQQQLAQRERQLRDSEQELERIRRTIRG